MFLLGANTPKCLSKIYHHKLNGREKVRHVMYIYIHVGDGKKRDERWTIALSSCFSRQPFDIMIIFYFWSNHFSWRFFMMFFFALWAFDALKYIWFFQHSSMKFILNFKINSFFVCFINIQNGSVVMFGRVASYKFVDSPSDGRYNLVLSQSQLDSACLYER